MYILWARSHWGLTEGMRPLSTSSRSITRIKKTLNIMLPAKYHVACKANGDGCMDETKFDGVTKINDHEFEFHNAHCFKIDVPQIGPAQAIYYDVAALKACCEHIKENHIPHPIVYIMACRIGPFAGHFYREIHKLGGTVFLNPDGECEIIWTTREKPDFMRVCAA